MDRPEVKPAEKKRQEEEGPDDGRLRPRKRLYDYEDPDGYD
jgi:hypothetical protein